MNKAQILEIRALDKKFSQIKTPHLLDSPSQGWIRTIRESLGMTSAQLAQRLGVSQARVAQLEKNESNLKLSTLKKVAGALGCTFTYAIIPPKAISEIIDEQAEKKAKTIMNNVNINMALEDQAVKTKELVEDTKREILDKHISAICD
jgi:predicted DNA-binding mobile mystery protein A